MPLESQRCDAIMLGVLLVPFLVLPEQPRIFLLGYSAAQSFWRASAHTNATSSRPGAVQIFPRLSLQYRSRHCFRHKLSVSHNGCKGETLIKDRRKETRSGKETPRSGASFGCLLLCFGALVGATPRLSTLRLSPLKSRECTRALKR